MLGILLAALLALDARAGNTFEELIRSEGKIPYPFETLYRKVGRSSIAVIPDSRSFQRGSVTYADPRIVVAQGMPDYADPPVLFLGYAPLAEEIEVIAWDQQEGRFDFMRVSDYGPGKVPVLNEAPRNVCLGCHQAEGPIFPRFPWSETTFNGQVVSGIRAARGGDPVYHGIRYVDLVGEETISLDPAKIDRQVRDANRRVQTAALCRTVCGEDRECRRDLLLAALNDPAVRLTSSRPARELARELAERLQVRVAGGTSWDPKAYPSSILPDRNPHRNVEEAGAVSLFEIADRGRLASYAVPGLFPLELILSADLNFEDRLAEFLLDEGRGLTRVSSGYASGRVGRPGFKRPMVSGLERVDAGRHLVANAYHCLGLAPEDDRRLLMFGAEELRSRVRGMGELLDSWPPEAERVLGALEEGGRSR